MSIDPQARGFNYGQPIGFKPPQWNEWCDAADRERQRSVHSTNTSWTLDMALRDIRIATTAEQYVLAVQKARVIFANLAAPSDDFGRVSTIPPLTVSATAENETDKAIHENDLKRLLQIARHIVAGCVVGPDCRYCKEDLTAALAPFANVDA